MRSPIARLGRRRVVVVAAVVIAVAVVVVLLARPHLLTPCQAARNVVA